VVTGLLTGHNALRRRPYIMGLTGSPLRRRCGLRKKPQLMFCVGVNLWPYFDIPTLEQSETSLERQESDDSEFSLRGTKGPFIAYMHRDRKGSNPLFVC
jgi:hypothetical protein